MEASETRRKTRKFLKTLSGKYQLFIVSIVLAILIISISYHQAVLTTGNGTEFSITGSIPNIIGILSALFLASTSCAVLDVIRLKHDHVEVGNNMIVFSNELFGKCVLTAILKRLFLFLRSLTTGAEIFTFAIGVIYAVVDDSAAGWVTVIIGLIAMITGFVLVIMENYSYSMTTYILYDDVQNGTCEGPRSIVDKSTELTKGNRWRFFCLQSSFIGWHILAAFTCGLPYFYTLPYTTTANPFFYEDLLENAE